MEEPGGQEGERPEGTQECPDDTGLNLMGVDSQYNLRMESATLTPAKRKPLIKSEDVFKIVTCAFVIIWSVSLKSFLKFREHLQANGMFYVSSESSYVVLFSFIFVFITKYGFYTTCREYFEKKLLVDKYEGDMRKAKLESTLKLTYDTFFYLFTAGTAFVLFRDQSWFPGWVGGKGSCQNIYREFPDIPQDKRVEMELFYAFQLGVHIFSVFEMVVIKRKTAQKYYEMLLHHMLAASLIVFSAMSNEITVGIMILFTHDISDVFLAFCRSYVETKLSKSSAFIIFTIINMLCWWIYMRILVFPLCIIRETVMLNAPETSSSGHIYYAHKLLAVKLIVLYGMHLYWTYQIVKSVVISIRKKKAYNAHETGGKKIDA